MKTLREQLDEYEVNAIELGNAPASLEDASQHDVIDSWIGFEVIEDVAMQGTVDGFSDEYDYLHEVNDELNNIPLFLERVEELYGDDSDIYEELDKGLDLFYTNMLWEAEDMARERELNK